MSHDAFLLEKWRNARRRPRRQCLVEIFNDVVAMLDADAETYHFRRDARLDLFHGRHLPVCRGAGWQASVLASPIFTKRFTRRSASVKSLARFETADNAESQQ